MKRWCGPGPGYVLPSTGAAIDAVRFEAHIRSAASGRAAPIMPLPSERFAAAVALVRGPPLAGVLDHPFARDAAPDWTSSSSPPTRVCRRRAGVGSPCCDDGATGSTCQRHPLWERFHAQLIVGAVPVRTSGRCAARVPARPHRSCRGGGAGAGTRAARARAGRAVTRSGAGGAGGVDVGRKSAGVAGAVDVVRRSGGRVGHAAGCGCRESVGHSGRCRPASARRALRCSTPGVSPPTARCDSSSWPWSLIPRGSTRWWPRPSAPRTGRRRAVDVHRPTPR